MRIFRELKGLFDRSLQVDTVKRSPRGKGPAELPKIPESQKTYADFKAKVVKGDEPTVSKVMRIVRFLLRLPKFFFDKIFRSHAGKGVSWQRRINRPSAKAEQFFMHQKGVNPRVLFHIHADMFGDNSKLQGSDNVQTYGYLLKYLETQQLCQIDSQLTNKLNDAYKLISGGDFVANALLRATTAFDNKTSVVIPGGWMGKPSGHAINYELIPEADEKCTMRFYNLGAGASHFAIEATGSKLRGPAFSEWRGISRENILNPEFFTAIGEMQGLVPGSTEQEYNEKDIFASLKGIVKPAEERPGVDAPIMALQQSGVCAWRSLMAVMRSHMNERDYKRIIIDIKLQSLKEHDALLSDQEWKKLGADFRNTEENLVYKSAVKLARTLSKGVTTGIITPQYAEEQMKVLQQIIHGMEKRGLQIESPFEKPKFQPPGIRVDEHSRLLKAPVSLEQGAIEGGTISKTPWANLYTTIADAKLNNFDSFEAEVDRLLDLCKKGEDEGDFAAIHVGLLDAVKGGSLKVFDDQTIPPEQAQNLIVKLKKVFDHYLRSCYGIEGGDKIYAESRYLALKILYWQVKLSQSAGYEFPIPHPSQAANSLHTRFYDSKMRGEIAKLKFGPWLQRNYNLQIPSLTWANQREQGSADCQIYPSGGEGFENFLRTNYKEVLENILTTDHKIAQIPQNLRPFALLYSSKIPEWIGAVRDSYLNLSHIDTFPIAQTTPPSLAVTYSLEPEGNDRWVISGNRQGVTSRLLESSPHQQSIKGNLFLRYCAAHRMATSFSIREFIKKYRDRSLCPSSEESLIPSVKTSQVKGMSEEEEAELIHIFVIPELQYSHLAEYFTKYPEKLRDPDYQTLFNMVLFDHEVLGKAPPQHLQKLESLIHLRQSEALPRGDIQLYTFLAEVKRRLGNPDSEEKLRELASNPELPSDEKGMAWAELAAHLSEKPILTNAELAELAEARAYLEANPLSKNWEDPQVTHALEQGIVRHAAALDNLLTESPDIVQGIFKNLFPASGEMEWSKQETKGFYPAWKSDNGQAAYFPLKGRFVFPGMAKTLPSEIREHFDFLRLFRGITTATASPDGGTWVFNDLKGMPTQVKRASDGSLSIQQQREGRWVEYIPPSLFDIELEQSVNPPIGARYPTVSTMSTLSRKELHSVIGSRYLHESQFAFRDVQRPSHWMLCDPKTGEVNYRIDVGRNRKIKSVQRKDGLRLGASKNCAFEDPEFAHYWYKGKTLQEVEFPRFGLTFSGPNLQCVQLPGWQWRPDRTVAGLKHFTDMLVLQDTKGNEKVILPNQNFSEQEENRKETLEPGYFIDRMNRSLPTLRQQYCLYTLDKKGRLVSNKRSDNLHLALTLTVAQNYRQAAKLLIRWGNKLSAFTPEEYEKCKNILETKAATGDTSANASVLQVYAGIRLLRQSDKQDKKLLNKTLKGYQTWLAKEGLTTCMSLPREDEIYLLKTALVEEQEPVFLNRLAELDPAAAAGIQIKNQEEISKTVNPQEAFAAPTVLDVGVNASAPKHALLTRPKELFFHFAYYKNQITSGDEKTIAWVKGALPYLACMKRGGSLARIYLAMIKEPEQFANISLVCHYGPSYLLERSNALNALIEAAKAVDVDPEALYQKLKTPPVTRTPKAASSKVEPTVQNPSPAIETIESWRSKSSSCVSSELKKHTLETTPLANWVRDQAAHGNQDRLVKQAFNALEEDVGVFSQQQEKGQVSYQVNDTEAFSALLYNGREENCTQLYQAKKEILELANQLPNEGKARAQEHLRRTFLNRKVLTMKSLLMNFATQRPAMLVRANPALSDDDIQKLYEKIGEYLALAVHEQQRERAIDEFEKGQSTKAAELFAAERCYDPNEHPEYLIFEQAANIMMRPQQVDNLKNLIAHGDQNPIMEMIMGSGKSKVLLPLLALMRADGEHLAVLVVPQPLFESVAQDTQASIGEAFGQQLKTLHFDRNTTFTALSLEHMRDLIVNAKRERQALIITSKSMQCLLLKYIEMMDAQATHGGKDKETAVMTEIITLLNRNTSPTLDEIDTLLSVLHEVSFSIGDPQSPDPWETTLTTHLFRALMENDALKKLGRLEIDSDPNLEAPPITEDLYKKSVMPALAEHLIANLDSLDLGDEKRNTELHNFAKALNPQNKENLKNYITRNANHVPSAQKFFDEQSDIIQDFLALAAEEITSILPHTLTRCVNENYGVDISSKSLLAIPFGGPNNPRKGSQFLSQHVTMAYTSQFYLHQGIGQEMVEKLIAQLQSRALNEVKDGEVQAISETKAWKEFCELRGREFSSMPLFKYTPSQLSQLTQELNNSVEKKCFFVEKFITPTLQAVTAGASRFAVQRFFSTVRQGWLHLSYPRAGSGWWLHRRIRPRWCR